MKVYDISICLDLGKPLIKISYQKVGLWPLKLHKKVPCLETEMNNEEIALGATRFLQGQVACEDPQHSFPDPQQLRARLHTDWQWVLWHIRNAVNFKESARQFLRKAQNMSREWARKWLMGCNVGKCETKHLKIPRSHSWQCLEKTWSVLALSGARDPSW